MYNFSVAVVELAVTSDLGSDAERRGGSSPFSRTFYNLGENRGGFLLNLFWGNLSFCRFLR